MRQRPDELVETTSTGSFADIAMRGTILMGGSQAISVLCQFLSVVFLSRLLNPSDFGLVAMCSPVIAFIGIFQNLGLTQAVIQKADLNYGQLNSLFWLNLVVCVVVALLIVGISPLAVTFYGEPAVGPLLIVMVIPVLVTALSAQHDALLNRRMSFGILAVASSVMAAVTLAVAITWAWFYPSYWAIAAGIIAGCAVRSAMIWRCGRWTPSSPSWADGTGTLTGFGAGLTTFNLTNFFSRNLDNILIGRYWGSDSLGLYDRAYKLLLFPLQRVADPLAKVMVPLLSRLNDEPERYRSAFFRVLNILQIVLAPGIAAATALSETLVPALLGERFSGAAPIFTVLGFAGIMQIFTNPAGWLFISQGRSWELARWG